MASERQRERKKERETPKSGESVRQSLE
jgi:hypothetical protein